MISLKRKILLLKIVGGISMSKKIALPVTFLIISGFFNSCRTNETPKLNQEPAPLVEQIGRIDSTNEPIYSLTEAPPANEPPSQDPITPPAPTPVPSVSPEKKPSDPKPLGSYQTPLLNRGKQRMDNIRLAMKKINGYKLKPGETFSFNDVVGKRDADHGFKIAAVIVNGEFGEDMGGGVCQLSSTIFNAADRAGMKILERHSHSREVKYVPKERDAAVSYGYLDLKFKNTKDYSVQLKVAVEDKRLKVYIHKAK
jgi:hypothetical protein